jgi:hypothetical protein
MIPAGLRICESGWMRAGVEVRLGPGDCERLGAVIGSGNSLQKHVWGRARIILRSADRVGTIAIHRQISKGNRRSCAGRCGSWPKASMVAPRRDAPWREAAADAGAGRDAPHRTAMRGRHWVCQAMAKAAGVSHRSVQRIWVAYDPPAGGLRDWVHQRPANRLMSIPNPLGGWPKL